MVEEKKNDKVSRVDEIFKEASKYDLTIRMLEQDDFKKGLRNLVPHEANERINDP